MLSQFKNQLKLKEKLEFEDTLQIETKKDLSKKGSFNELDEVKKYNTPNDDVSPNESGELKFKEDFKHKFEFNLDYLIQNTTVKIEKINYDKGVRVEALTPRLSILPVTMEDVDFFQKHFWGDSDVMQKFGGGKPRFYWPGTEESATKHNYAEKRIEGWIAKWNNGDPYAGYTVRSRETGEIIGHVVVGGGEVAYMIRKDQWKKGFGTEAIAALTNVIIPLLIEQGYVPTYLKDNLTVPFDEIYGTVRLDHTPSQRVLQKSGFTSDLKIDYREFDKQMFERYIFKAKICDLQKNYINAMKNLINKEINKEQIVFLPKLTLTVHTHSDGVLSDEAVEDEKSLILEKTNPKLKNKF